MVDVRNSNEVKLVVDSATNGITWDHADWAEARFRNIAKFNTAKLEEVLTKAENINLNNYTQESIERLENAINVGKEALSSANQETIDKAIEKLKEAMDSLVELMNKTDKVHIVAPGTDLTFSINGIPAEKYYGTFNIPDGEVATCPVKNSVNGYITYNTKTKYNDIIFEDIKFDFINGKIVKATAKENSKELNEILDTDDGARYIGEFAFGLNPYVNNTMCDTLFDEKINGSLHLTPGMALEESDNGNRSAIHWDIVKILRKEFGGGEIYFDNVLIMKDGKFVLDEVEFSIFADKINDALGKIFYYSRTMYGKAGGGTEFVDRVYFTKYYFVVCDGKAMAYAAACARVK